MLIRVIKFVLIIALSLSCISCTLGIPKQLNGNNYIKNIQIHKDDSSFYTGHYTGNEHDCFPPINRKICLGENIYAKDDQLNIESFSINFTIQSFFKSDTTNELAYLTIADLAIQRGYKFFTITKETSFGLITEKNSISTNATRVGNSIIATSTAGKIYNEGSVHTLNFILFNNFDDLKKGVFSEGRFFIGGKYFEKRIFPYVELYNGTAFYNYHVENELNENSYYTIKIPENSWKIGFDAERMSADIRKKYNINNSDPIKFITISDSEILEERYIDQFKIRNQ